MNLETSWYVCVCVCVFIFFHYRGFSWLKQNNKCNAMDQANNVVLRKSKETSWYLYALEESFEMSIFIYLDSKK